MKISFENYSIFLNTDYFFPEKPTIIFIHGFTGSSNDWLEIIPQIDNHFSVVAVDLIGHGKSSSPNDFSLYKIGAVNKQLKKIIETLKLDKVIITGYSMGGRVALNFANEFPNFVNGLILESTTAGIIDKKERADRYKNDLSLSQKILDDGIEKFVDYWMNLPIFSSQKNLSKEKLNDIHSGKLNNDPIGLSNSLIGYSTGRMQPLFDRLSNFNFPVLIISGEKDGKFCKINSKMNDLIPFSEHKIVKGAGHNIHLEMPSDFVILVNRFLRTNFI